MLYVELSNVLMVPVNAILRIYGFSGSTIPASVIKLFFPIRTFPVACKIPHSIFTSPNQSKIGPTSSDILFGLYIPSVLLNV